MLELIYCPPLLSVIPAQCILRPQVSIPVYSLFIIYTSIVQYYSNHGWNQWVNGRDALLGPQNRTRGFVAIRWVKTTGIHWDPFGPLPWGFDYFTVENPQATRASRPGSPSLIHSGRAHSAVGVDSSEMPVNTRESKRTMRAAAVEV